MEGANTGVVFAVSTVASGSASAPVMTVPLTGVSSFVVLASLTITGVSLTEITLNINVSFSHIEGKGVPPSQTLMITVSLPLYRESGMYV